MANRQYYSAESLGESTTTNTGAGGGSDKLTLTFTPDAGATYAIFCSAQASSDGTTADYFVAIDIWEGTPGSPYDALKFGAGMRPHEFSSPQDYFGFFACVAYTEPGSPASKTWTMNFYASNGQTVRIKNARMIAIRLDDTHDHIEANYSDSSIGGTTSSSWSDGLTLNFTPASTGDYLILAFGCMLPDVNGGRHAWRLNDGANNYGGWQVYNPDDNGGWTGCIARKYASLSGSSTFKVQFQSPDNSTWVGLMGATILALRLDQFPNVYESDSFTVASGTPTTYTDRLTLNFTPAAAVAHLAIATCAFRIGSTTVSGYAKAVLSNPSLSQEYTWEGQNTAGYNTTFGFAAIVTPSVASSSFKFQTRSESGTNTHYIDGQALALIQLEAPATVTVSASLGAAVQKALSASVGAAGAVQKINTATAGAAGALQTLRTLTADAGGALAIAAAETVAAAGAVQAGLTATAGAGGAVQALRTLGTDAGGAVAIPRTGTIGAAGAAQALISAQTDLDIAVLRAVTIGLGASSAVQQARTVAAGLDTAAQALITATVGANALIAAPGASAVIADCDAAVQAARAATASLDAAVAVVLQATFGTDAAVLASRTLTAAVQAAVQASRLVASSADGAAAAVRAAALSIAAAVSTGLVGTIGADAVLRVSGFAPGVVPTTALAGAIERIKALAGSVEAGAPLAGTAGADTALAGSVEGSSPLGARIVRGSALSGKIEDDDE